MPLKKWTKLSENIAKKNDFWSYKIDRFKIGNGMEREYHYLHTNGSTMIIPITADNKILMVNQYRYLNQNESFEFPCGSVEEGMSIIENAQKELQEETGYRSDSLNKIGFFAPFTGASDEICTVFSARNLVCDPLPSDETEEFEIHMFLPDEINSMIKNNTIWDGLTISAWALSKHKIFAL
jgi:ADP-ribose pyrophosphatase